MVPEDTMTTASRTRLPLLLGMILLTAGCAGLGDLDSSSSSSSGYPGYGSPGGGYGGSGYGSSTREYRGPLPPGSYTASCRNMAVERGHLEAECQRLDGRWRQTRLDLDQCGRGIRNVDGHLECPEAQTIRLPPGSYRDSCRDYSMDGRQLEAQCRRRNGDWRDTRIDLSKCKAALRNDDGRLTCG
jgi:hypothetical protein